MSPEKKEATAGALHGEGGGGVWVGTAGSKGKRRKLAVLPATIISEGKSGDCYMCRPKATTNISCMAKNYFIIHHKNL